MTGPHISPFDFSHAVAQQFDDRPTLRQVLGKQLLSLLLEQLPWLKAVEPPLPSADPLMLDSPDPDTPYWTTQPLVDRVLQALLDPEPLNIEALDGRHHNLGLTGDYRFTGSHDALDTRQLSGLSAALNDLVAQLPDAFCQAQLDYWRAPGHTGVSRDQWLQLLLKTALLRGMPLQGLDAQEQACVRGLLRGGWDQPPAFFVQASLSSGGLQFDEMQCSLLLLGEWDERLVCLWCAPSGQVRGFPSLDAFGQALRDELAQRYRFERMSWRRLPVEGNVFAQQAALLLETLFDRVDRLRHGRLAGVAELERRFAELSDPAVWFARYLDDTPAVTPPAGLVLGSQTDSFACSAALLWLGLAQLDADGVAALDGVQSLTDYARQRLNEQIHQQHRDDSSADDLVLELYLAHGVPGGAATGAGGGEPLVFAGSKTLTEFAIGNLGSLNGAIIRQVRRAQGGEAPAWLNADSAKALVTQVDIGGRYPAYVAGELDDPERRAVRVERFAREWRSALLFSAVSAKVDGKVSEVGLQCVVDFCAGHLAPAGPRMTLFPLAFRRSAKSAQRDKIQGMYVLFCAEPPRVLLYRPLYRQDTVREYVSLAALLEHIRESSVLQQSLLNWMAPQVRPIYDLGGFTEPHIASVGLDPYTLPERPAPAVLDIELWNNDLDERLYMANRDLLVELAGMQSVSAAQYRWQSLCEGAWLLFDVVTLAVRGPVATVAWLVQLLGSLESDLQALEQGGEFDRSAAVVDVLLNMGMMLLHAHQPGQAPIAVQALPEASVFEGPAAQRGAFSEISVVPAEGSSMGLEALASLPDRRLDFAWRGQRGFNWLPVERRQALQAMRSSVALNGLSPLASGADEGLYRVEGRLYAAMAGDAYLVERSAEGVRVVDERGDQGPWLVCVEGAWRVDGSLRLAGGVKPSGSQARLARRFQALREESAKLDRQVRDATQAFSTHSDSLMKLQDRHRKLSSLRAKEREKLEALPEGRDTASTQALIGQYDVRLAEWHAQIDRLRDESIRQLEEAVRGDMALIPLLATMREPKFAAERRAANWDEVLASRQTVVQANVIRNTDYVFHEVWGLVDYHQLAKLQEEIDGRPLLEVVDRYLKLRHEMQAVVDFQDRMLVMCEYLDELLADAPEDLVITATRPEQTLTVGQIIDQRKFSTVQFRFQQILNLGELALHLDNRAGQHLLAGYREELAGISLRNAAEAHGDLAFANLSLEDTITILQEAWDEYTAALLNSERIRAKGGALIEAPMLDRYREHVEKLKRDAGRRLVEAIREQEGGSASGRRTPYRVSSQPQRALRNREGQLLIGTEIEVDGQRVVEVRESFSQAVLARFDWVDHEWRQREHERERTSSTDDSAPVDSSLRVQALLDENEVICDKAQEYVKNDIKGALLVLLFERQVVKLDLAMGILRDEGASHSLIRALEMAGDRLRSQKNLLLTTLYTDTHYPSAEALQFLHAQQLLKVEYVARKTMANGNVFDEYKVMRLATPGAAQGRNLWVAHFHLPSADAYAEEFTQGHLKTWRQGRMSGSKEEGSNKRVHRGKLTLEQARGIIPFR